MAAAVGRIAIGGLGRLAGKFGRRPNLNDYPNMKYGLGKMGNSALAGAGTMAGGMAMKGLFNVLTGNGPIQRRKKAQQATAGYPGGGGGGGGCCCSAPRKPTCVKKRAPPRKPVCRPRPKPKMSYCSTGSSGYRSSGTSMVPYGGSKPRVAGRQYRRNTRVAGRQARRTNRQAARQQRRFNRRN